MAMSAQASAAASAFAAQNPDLIFVVGVPAAQALKTKIKTTPVIFGGPPDPVAAGLVTSMKNHSSNFTGTSYFPQLTRYSIHLSHQMPPNAKIAVIHNPGEANSKAVVTKFLAAAEDVDTPIIDFAVTNVIEIEAALRAMKIKGVTGLFIPTDNLIYSNLERITSVANSLDISVFNCTKLSVERGADFSLATDYYTVGTEAGNISADILFNNKRVQDIDVFAISEGKMFIKASKKDVYGQHVPEGYEAEYVELIYLLTSVFADATIYFGAVLGYGFRLEFLGIPIYRLSTCSY